MKQLFKSFLSAISIGLMVSLLQSCTSTPKDVLEKNALELNRSCPVQIDSYTQLDSARYVADGNSFQYYYTLSGDKDNSGIAQREQPELRQRIIDFIKHEPTMATYRRHHVVMEYIYYSQNSGHELFRVTVTPDMYR